MHIQYVVILDSIIYVVVLEISFFNTFRLQTTLCTVFYTIYFGTRAYHMLDLLLQGMCDVVSVLPQWDTGLVHAVASRVALNVVSV